MALILKRAAELQATGEEPVHSLEAIQQIAQQVGIDPQRIVEAAAAIQAPSGASSHLIFGAPSVYRLTREVVGSLEAADHAALIATIRDHLPEVGRVNEFAGGFEWHAGPADHKTAISFTPTANGTAVRDDGRYFATKFVCFTSASAITLVTGLAGLGVSPELGVGLGLGMFALSFTSARLLWNRVASAGRRRLERLLGALVEQLGRSPADSSEPQPSAHPFYVLRPMTPGHTALRLLTALAPLSLTPVLATAINAGRLNFGGGEKDIVLLVPWLLWSLFFAGVALICWRRHLRLGPSLLWAGLWATAVVIFSGLVFTVFASRILGVSKGG